MHRGYVLLVLKIKLEHLGVFRISKIEDARGVGGIFTFVPNFVSSLEAPTTANLGCERKDFFCSSVPDILVGSNVVDECECRRE